MAENEPRAGASALRGADAEQRDEAGAGRERVRGAGGEGGEQERRMHGASLALPRTYRKAPGPARGGKRCTGYMHANVLDRHFSKRNITNILQSNQNSGARFD